METTESGHHSPLSIAPSLTLRLLYSGDAGVVMAPVRALRPGETQLGREVPPALGIGLCEDRRASRMHAVIHTDASGGQVRLVDAESKNGSFVNGRREQECVLRDGDVVRVGNSFLLLRCEPARQVDAEVPSLLGSSPAIRAARDAIAQGARSGATVLLLGESGVGKEVAAQALHRLSRRPGPLVAVNCAAIPEALAESQLFGHVPGSFTGARTAQDGYFRSAHGGTLFLDELGELPLSMQAKLLRVLEDRNVMPVGGTRAVTVDIWLLAATNRDLIEAVNAGRFRGDLYARLAQVVVPLPPLRQRREDVLPLLLHLIGVPKVKLSPELVEALLLHPWPFNVRELGQIATLLRTAVPGATELDLPLVAERLAANARVGTAPARPAPPHHAQKTPAEPDPLDDLDGSPKPPAPPLTREELEGLLREHKGNVSKVAQAAQRSRRQIDRWMEQYGFARKHYLD